MSRRRIGAALAALGIAASLWAADPEPEAKKPEAPKPPPEAEKLNYFAAPWTSEGTVKPGPNGPGGATQGRAMCRWMPGKFFLDCMMESKDPAGTLTQMQSTLGWDAEKKVYRSWSFDNLGRYETATGTLKDDTWTWTGEAQRGDKTDSDALRRLGREAGGVRVFLRDLIRRKDVDAGLERQVLEDGDEVPDGVAPAPDAGRAAAHARSEVAVSAAARR